MTYKDNYRAWLNDPAICEEDKQQLRALKDEKEIEDRFYKELEFGTAGMRGVIGLGTNRMNVYTVKRATQGLSNALAQSEGAKARGVAIAYDSRHMSGEFARIAALVLCANGIKVYLYESLRSVPQLSFTVRHLGCAAGIVITASHNPREYNGYKVYGEDGGQIGPEQAKGITRQIQAVAALGAVKEMDEGAAQRSGLFEIIGSAVDEAYYAKVEALTLRRDILAAAADFKLVYTPLHGTGNLPVRRVLKDAGMQRVAVVREQELPDGDFPTVEAPNPELPGTFEYARALAREQGADLLLATDPDADRLGVAVCDEGGGFTVLSGNQIGCLLLHYILKQRKELGTLPENALAVKSIVSTSMANAICADFGVQIAEVLTGFRYIAGKIADAEATGSHTFVFGFEESFGYLVETFVRDKDAISAALMLAEAAAYYSTRGMSLLDGLQELFETYGYYGEAVRAYTLYGVEGMGKIQGAMAQLRENPPASIGGERIRAVRDYDKRTRRAVDSGELQPMDMPASNVLYYELESGAWLCVRPSGTEPKLKMYAGGKGASLQQADEKLAAMIDEVEQRLKAFLL